MNKENYLKTKPTITLDSGKVKCLSNIPAGYCMEVGTPGQVPYRLAGTPHGTDYSMVGVGVKLKFFNKVGPNNLWRRVGPERMGTTMKSIKKLAKKNKLNSQLRYFHLLNQARQVADILGKRLMKAESKRIREKYLFLESIGMLEER